MWLTLGIGQLYVFLRHYLKLVFYASETSYFQGAVAHALVHSRTRGGLAGVTGRGSCPECGFNRPMSRRFPKRCR